MSDDPMAAVSAMTEKLAALRAERDRLRAVVDALRDMAERVTDTNEDGSEYEEGNAVAWEYVRRQLSQLDVSPTMGDQYVTPEELGNPDWYRDVGPDTDTGAVHHTLLGHYLSTYCLHDEHEGCRLTCKVCEAPCRCGCHHGAPDA